MNKALALEVARELNLSPQKVNAVCKSFHDGLRALISKPETCKSGIMIQGLLVLKLKDIKLQETLEWSPYTKEVKQQILDNIKKYKRNESVKKKQTKS